MPPLLDQLFSKLPLIVFLAAIVIYWIGAFIILYHLIRFGIGNKPKFAAFVFFAGSIVCLVLMFATFLAIS